MKIFSSIFFHPEKFQKSKNLKHQNFDVSDFLIFEIFQGEKKLTKKFSSKKIRAPKNFSSELEIFLGYSFDVKFCGLSIYDVFRVIRALLRGFKSSLLFYNRTNPVPERCVALVPSWGRPWFWA